MKKISLFIISIIFAAVNLFAEINVLSPVEGTWANKQMLVIENTGDGDYLYSLDGSDPESFGFAYDGPVLIDLTGNVNLKVAFLPKSGNKETTSVTYKVVLDDGSKTGYKNFVKTFYYSGIINYSAGSNLSIPGNLKYSLGLPPDAYLQGTNLTISEKSVLQRLLPCSIYDPEKNVKYRFIIKTFPHSAGVYSKREVPFTITDWETITFNDKNYIYKVDSEYWSLPTEARKLDRSISHMISWQSLDFKEGNPVEYFVLPPKPEIIVQKNEDGSFIYSVKGDKSYALSVLSPEKNDYMELFPEIGADIFYGDKASGSLNIGVFASSVYQGKVIAKYNINKRPPAMPEITSSAKSFYSRNRVQVDVSGDKNADLYIALSEPYSMPATDKLYTADSEILKNIPVGEYKKARNGKYTIYWNPKSVGAAYYKISAYSKNGKNTSQIAEYSIIIDQSSYYYDENADADLAEGTAEHPFTSFDQCVTELSDVRAVTLKVKGNLRIEKKYQIESNYELQANGDACISFGPDAALTVKGSSFEIYDCRISNEINNQVKTVIPLFKLENAVLTVRNCTFGLNYSSNGSGIDAYNSIINISDSIASVNALIYASFISSVKSRISIKNVTASASADTCVVLSATDGTLSATDNTFSVTGKSGRIAELFGVRANFTDNTFKAQLENNGQKTYPVYKNEATVLTESGNMVYGF